jgi:hypothetical protein
MQDTGLGGTQFIACHFEGGRSQLRINVNNCHAVGCMTYGHFGGANTTMVRIEGNDNIIEGMNFAGSNSNYYALQFGTAAGTARSGNMISGIFNGFSTNSPFNFASDGGNFIFARGFSAAAGATSFGGTISASTIIRYNQGGTVIDTSAGILPNVTADLAGFTISGGTTRPLVVKGTVLTSQLERYSADASPNGVLVFKSRNATIGSHTIVQNNDEIARFEGRASDGAAFISLGYISWVVDGTPGVGDMPSRAIVTTTRDGTSSPVECMRWDSNGMPIFTPGSATPATLGTNGQLTLTLTSNTNLRFSYRGSDGTTRVANITLA